MADEFSFLTDSDDERAVEDVLSQALDHSVLEQIAAINCSSFSTSDNLPSDLENRFRKLKSLPSATTTAGGSRPPPSKSKSFTPQSGHDSVDFERIPDLEKSSPFTGDPEDLSDGNRQKSSSNSKKLCETKGLKSRYESGSSESSPSTDDLEQHSDGDQDEKKVSNSRSKSLKSSKEYLKTKSMKSKSRTDSWSVSSPESESRSVSPPRRGIGCLWCSPKKEKRKQGKENRLSSWGNEYDVEFLKTFSVKEQKKIMRQAMKEEEKINREAEKIVKWAKQASSRMMDVSGVVDDDQLY